jgi:hypothetical protein
VLTDADGTYIGQLFVYLNAPSLNVGGVIALTVILVRPVHPQKALIPILVTPDGMSILVRLVHS